VLGWECGEKGNFFQEAYIGAFPFVVGEEGFPLMLVRFLLFYRLRSRRSLLPSFPERKDAVLNDREAHPPLDTHCRIEEGHPFLLLEEKAPESPPFLEGI